MPLLQSLLRGLCIFLDSLSPEQQKNPRTELFSARVTNKPITAMYYSSPILSPDLRLEYSVHGRAFPAVHAAENSSLHLGPGHEGLQITMATYGSHHHKAYVTDVLRRHVNGASLNLHVSNATMGCDPCLGQAKGAYR